MTATIRRNSAKDNAVETMPHTYPTFAEEHITPFVSSLLIQAKTIAVIPSANQPIKKLTIPQIFDHVASCDSDISVAIGFGLGADSGGITG